MNVGGAPYINSQFQKRSYAFDIPNTTVVNVIAGRSNRIMLGFCVFKGNSCVVSPEPNIDLGGATVGGFLIGQALDFIFFPIQQFPGLVGLPWYAASGFDSKLYVLEIFEQPTDCGYPTAPETQVRPPAGGGETVGVNP